MLIILTLILRKSAILHFGPTPNPLYYTTDLLAGGFTGAGWTFGRNARPLAAALGPW